MIRIPGYRVVRPLASGASGTVYRAIQENLSRDVALKVLAPGLFDAEETRARFMRETKIQGRLSHPNILALYDAGFAGDVPYMAVELVEGGSLRDLLDRDGSLSPAAAVRLAASIADGLLHAHEAGIVHRDLKPENVLLTADGLVKVADFGLAKALSADQTVQTATGTVLGTPGYIAPEVIQGEAARPESDVYALGAMVYEMLAGRRPAPAGAPGPVLLAQLKGDYEPLRQARPGTPPALDSFVDACLALEPRDRPSMATAVNHLALLGKDPGNAEGPMPTLKAASAADRKAARLHRPSMNKTMSAKAPAEKAPPARSFKDWLATAAAALLLLAVMLAVFHHAKHDADQARESKSPPSTAGVQTTQVSSVPVPVTPGPGSYSIRMSAGTSMVRLELAQPAPEGWRRAGSTSRAGSARGWPPWVVSNPIGAGQTLLTAGGLRPACEHQWEIAAGAARRTESFLTLRESTARMVVDPTRSLDGLTSVVRGGEVLLAGRIRFARPGVEQVRLHESPDGGSTWFPPIDLFEATEISHPWLLDTALGLYCLCSRTDAGGRSSVAVRLRARGSREWGTAIEVTSSQHEPALTELPGSKAGLLYWTPAPPGVPASLLWTRFALGASAIPEGKPAGDVPHREKHSRCIRLLNTGHGLLLTSRSPEGSPANSFIQTSVTSDPEAGGWPPPRRVTGPDEMVSSDPSSLVFRDEVFLAYESNRTVAFRGSSDWGRSWGPPSFPTGEDGYFLEPKLCATGGRLLLTAYTMRPLARGGPTFAHVLSSADGGSWQPIGRVGYPAIEPRMIHPVVLPDRVLIFVTDVSKGLLAGSIGLGAGTGASERSTGGHPVE